MARRGNVGYKSNNRSRVRLSEKGSDESDEDYKVGEDEELDESEDECSLAEDDSDMSFGELEKEELVKKKAKKAGRSNFRRGSQGRQKNGAVKPKNQKVAYSEEEEEEEEEEDEEDEEEEEDFKDEDFDVVKERRKNRVIYKEEKNRVVKPKKKKVSYSEEEGEEDEEDFEDDDFDLLEERRKEKVSSKEKKNRIVKPKKENVAYSEEEDEDDYFEDEDFDVVKERNKKRVSYKGERNRVVKPIKKKVIHSEEEEDFEYDDFDVARERNKNRASCKGERNRVVKPIKKKVVHSDDEEDDDDFEDGNFDVARERNKNRASYKEERNGFVNPKKKKVTDSEEEQEEEEEEDFVDDDFDVVKERHKDRASCIEQRNGPVKPKEISFCFSEEEEEEEEEEDDFEDDDFDVVKEKGKRVSCKGQEDNDIEVSHREQEKFDYEKSRKRSRVSYKDDNFIDEENRMKEPALTEAREFDCGNDSNEYDPSDHYDYDNDDDSDDDEFRPDEIDGTEDEESPVGKRNRLDKHEKYVARGKKRSRNRRVSKKMRRKKPMKSKGPGRKTKNGHGKNGKDDNQMMQQRRTKVVKRRRGRSKSTVNSDTDIVHSGSSSGYEFTISEEEREQVREASEFCRSLATNLRSSSPLKMMEVVVAPPKRKRLARKGKEKVEDPTVEVGKQVCGICLSEEVKRTIRGTLNCCSHFFCFACIMEWSKVESRCPLCKQRFATITKTAQADSGHDLRTQVISVPERDQVYQPTEEELRGYLDPYENVLCTECQQGGDDALMLLCDLCDSPAHTYCVGLGREVPEGNWYCEGCRPTALASSNLQGSTPAIDNGGSNHLSVGSSPVPSVRETFDLNELYVPETPMTQGTASPSPRHHVGDPHFFSAATGSGAFTVLERRRIQRQIHHLLNHRSRQLDRSNRDVAVSGNNLFGNLVGRGREVAPQLAVTPETMAQENINIQGRFQGNTTPTWYNREFLAPGLSSLRGQILHNQASTSSQHSLGGLSPNEFAGVSARIGIGLGNQEPHPCSIRSSNGNGFNVRPPQYREATLPSTTLQGALWTPF